MKTADNGATFQAVFEKEAVAAIGAVAVAPSDPKVVWVGTGEANDRNSSSWGNGVYLSTDAGGTWTNVGLKESKTIARIVVHPSDPRTAWVAASGDLWRPGGERGLYKTTDGGATWKAVLTAPAPYGGPGGGVRGGHRSRGPRHALRGALCAAAHALVLRLGARGHGRQGPGRDLQERRRRRHLAQAGPGAARGHGPDRHRRLAQEPARRLRDRPEPRGRNERQLRRCAAARAGSSAPRTAARAGPARARSTRGRSTSARSASIPRTTSASTSWASRCTSRRTAAGASARTASRRSTPTTTPWPWTRAAPSGCVLGTDGGVYQSFNAGETWDHLSRMAAGEYYRIAVDDSVPYRICGGLQDNQTWVGPSRTRTKDGIVNSDWIDLGGGDGFYCAFDPEDPHLIYAESQEGFLQRIDLKSGEIKGLRPEPQEGQVAFRFHWNSPLLASRHDKGVLYLAGNRVFKLTAQGRGVDAHQPRPDRARSRQDRGGGQRGRELRRRLHAGGVSAEGRPAVGGHGRRKGLGHGGRGRPLDRPHRQPARGGQGRVDQPHRGRRPRSQGRVPGRGRAPRLRVQARSPTAPATAGRPGRTSRRTCPPTVP